MAPRENTRESKGGLGCASLYIISAFSLIVAATVACDFVTVTGTDPFGTQETFTRGIWKGQEGEGTSCRSYTAFTYVDSRWKAAMAMSIIASFLGGSAVVPMVCACGNALGMREVMSISSNCTWACLFSGLTFLILTSSACTQALSSDLTRLTDVACTRNRGANMAIAATVLFFFAFMSTTCAFALASAAALQEEIAAGEEGKKKGGDEEGG